MGTKIRAKLPHKIACATSFLSFSFISRAEPHKSATILSMKLAPAARIQMAVNKLLFMAYYQVARPKTG